MIDPATGAIVMEVAKLGLQIFFTQAKMAGKSPEEIDQMFQAEKAKFDQYDPNQLPDV